MGLYYLHGKCDGAYMCPQGEPFPDAVEMNEDQISAYREFHGFGDIVDGIFTGDQALLDAWNNEHPNTPATPEATAQDDTDAMIVDHEYRLTLLELGVADETSSTEGGES